MTCSPNAGRKRRRRRRSGQSQREDGGYSGSGSESESDSEISEGGKKYTSQKAGVDGSRVRRKRLSGKSDDFRTGIVPYTTSREGKARRIRRSSGIKGNGKENEEPYYYSSSDSILSDTDEEDKGPAKK